MNPCSRTTSVVTSSGSSRTTKVATLERRRCAGETNVDPKVDSHEIFRFLQGAVVVHEPHVPVICELHLDLFCCESSVAASVLGKKMLCGFLEPAVICMRR